MKSITICKYVPGGATPPNSNLQVVIFAALSGNGGRDNG